MGVNKDGSLTLEELQRFFLAMGVPEKEVSKPLAEWTEKEWAAQVGKPIEGPGSFRKLLEGSSRNELEFFVNALEKKQKSMEKALDKDIERVRSN